MTSWLLSLYPDATQLWVPTQDHCSLLFWVLTTPITHMATPWSQEFRVGKGSYERPPFTKQVKEKESSTLYLDKEDVVHHTVEYYSAMKKNKITPFEATWMLEILLMSEVSQGGKNIIWHPLFVESKKRWYKWTYLQHIKRLTDLDKELTVSRVG